MSKRLFWVFFFFFLKKEFTPEITSARNTPSLFSLGKRPVLLRYLLLGPGHHSGSLKKGQGSGNTLQFRGVVEKNRCAF